MYNTTEICRLLDEIFEINRKLKSDNTNEVVSFVVEDVNSLPSDGVVQAFSLGKGAGIWEGVIVRSGFTPNLVKPNIWKKSLGLSKDKEDSRADGIKVVS